MPLCSTCQKIPFDLFAPDYCRISPHATIHEYPTPIATSFCAYKHLSYAQIKSSAWNHSPCQLCLILFEEILAGAKREKLNDTQTEDILPDDFFYFLRHNSSTDYGWQLVEVCRVMSQDNIPYEKKAPVINIQYNIVGRNLNTWDRVYNSSNLYWPQLFRTPESKRYISVKSNSTDRSDLIRSWIQTCLEEHPTCLDGVFSQHLNHVGLRTSARPAYSSSTEYELQTAETTRWLQKRTAAGQVISESTQILNADLKYVMEYAAALPKSQFLPSRLIDVGAGYLQEPRLRTQYGSDAQYVTLSHCWGSSPGSVTRLTTDTLPARLAGIPLDTLPQTFRDAVVITRKLGVQYLWIDSLCIIQDDVEDWQREAKVMGDVYAHALCTIAASSSTDSTHGIFHPKRPWDLRPCLLAWSGDPNLANISGVIITPTVQDQQRSLDYDNGKIRNRADVSEIVEQSWLSTRAWTLQERALSRRIVHFTKGQLVWECKSLVATEAAPDRHDLSFRMDGIIQPIIWSDPDQFHDQAGTSTLRADLHRLWRRVLSDYSARNLTKATDRLPALSGLAAKFRDWTGSNYLAGLWESDVIHDLLWAAYPVERREFEKYCPPSETVEYLADGDDIESSRQDKSMQLGVVLSEECDPPMAPPIVPEKTPCYPSVVGDALSIYQASARAKYSTDKNYQKTLKTLADSRRNTAREFAKARAGEAISMFNRDKRLAQFLQANHHEDSEELRIKAGMSLEEYESKIENSEPAERVRKEEEGEKEDLEEYIAPSWSWASYSGPVTWFPLGRFEPATDEIDGPPPLRSAHITNSNLILAGPDPNGELCKGSNLTMAGRLRFVPYKPFDPDRPQSEAYFWISPEPLRLHVEGGYPGSYSSPDTVSIESALRSSDEHLAEPKASPAEGARSVDQLSGHEIDGLSHCSSEEPDFSLLSRPPGGRGLPAFDILLDRPASQDIQVLGIYIFEVYRGSRGDHHVLALVQTSRWGEEFSRIGVGETDRENMADWFEECCEEAVILV